MEKRSKKKRMFINKDRILITDKKGKPIVCIGCIDETPKPRTIKDISCRNKVSVRYAFKGVQSQFSYHSTCMHYGKG